MKAVVLKTSKKSRYLFGVDDTELTLRTSDILHSDTIFSAIVNAYSLLYREPSPVIESFKSDRIKISSGFWGISVYRSNKLEEFYPLFIRPVLPFRDEVLGSMKTLEDMGKIKRLKKIKYVSLKVFKDILESIKEIKDKNLLDGNFFIDMDPCDKDKYIFLSDGSILFKRGEFRYESDFLNNSFWIRGEKTRIKLETEEDNKLFYEEPIFIKEYKVNEELLIKPDIFFLVDGEFDDKFIASIRFLLDEGIGGERSIGANFFEGIEILDNESKVLNTDLNFKNKNYEYGVNLSLAFPKEGELNKIKYYEYIKRSGFIYRTYDTGIPKKPVNLIKEGSILKYDFIGDIVDVGSSGYKAYKYGKAFLAGFDVR